MNRKSKKSFTFILCLLLASALVLASCNKAGTTAKTEQTTAANQATPAQAANTQSNEKAAAMEPMTLSVTRGEHPAQPLIKDSPALKEIERITGIKIDINPVPDSDYRAKVKTLLATNHIPDVIQVTTQEVQDYAKTGILLDISKYIDKDAPNMKAMIQANPEMNKVTVDGHFYGFPITQRYQVIYGRLPMIRTDILQKLNLSIPKSYDDLYNVLKKMKEAYPDSYPWTMRNKTDGNLWFLAYGFGSGYKIYYEPKQDKYLYGPAHSEFKPVLEYLNKLYKEKLLDPNFSTATIQQWQENLSSGKSFFFYDNNSFTVNFNSVLQKQDPNAKFDMVPVMTNPTGERRNFINPVGDLVEQWSISSKVKDPDRIVKLFDWMYSQEGTDITNFGVPGKDFTRTGDSIKINEDLIKMYADKQDPFRALSSALGIGLLSFADNLDDKLFEVMSPPELKKWSDTLIEEKKQGLVQPVPLDPPFNQDEIEKLKQLNAKVDTIVVQNMDKFILGSRPLSEFDAFTQELKAQGSESIEKIYNDAYARIKK